MSRDCSKSFFRRSGNVYILYSNTNTEESILSRSSKTNNHQPRAPSTACYARENSTAMALPRESPRDCARGALPAATNADHENCAESISKMWIKNMAHLTIPCRFS